MRDVMDSTSIIVQKVGTWLIDKSWTYGLDWKQSSSKTMQKLKQKQKKKWKWMNDSSNLSLTIQKSGTNLTDKWLTEFQSVSTHTEIRHKHKW